MWEPMLLLHVMLHCFYNERQLQMMSSRVRTKYPHSVQKWKYFSYSLLLSNYLPKPISSIYCIVLYCIVKPICLKSWFYQFFFSQIEPSWVSWSNKKCEDLRHMGFTTIKYNTINTMIVLYQVTTTKYRVTDKKHSRTLSIQS